ncbi:arylsulfatase [Gaoshiqia sediminis]|uniref:Arylsulfatase n=1 Tax=Gaoshiqia sediminis TaxID=2986998 RepID=A0AA42C709_9BACT|nr:arylsulfatase [Gaoshiqia sediminis]MCW0484503.1 arylsulfatase [Gaoshiqia sediminis]
MKTSHLKLSQFVLLSVATSACAIAQDEKQHDKPNILVILADDMGYSDIGCYGGEINTPNIDQLAREGIRFSQFYNAARCCPTRASLLTGLYPHEAGMGGMVSTHTGNKNTGPYQGYLNDECVTIAEVLRDAGYYIAAAGKWHVGEDRPNWPIDRGFENYHGLISGASNYFDMTKTKSPNVKRVFVKDSTAYVPDQANFYMTDFITKSALEYLKVAQSKEKPFFLYLAYTAPHWPLHALPEDIQKYRGRFLKGWDVLREERFDRMKELEIVDSIMTLSERDDRVHAWETLSDDQKDKMDLLMSIYAAQLDRMDQGIGRVMDELKQMGVSDNTLVLFLSDNGACEEEGIWGKDFWGNFWDGKAVPGSGDSYHSYGRSWANLSNTPFRMFKSWVHEGGIITPLIARWPNGIDGVGRITKQPGTIMDIMATCCDLAQVEYPEYHNGKKIKPSRGRSLAPIFNGETREKPGILFWEHQGNAAVRAGDWKLVSKDGEEWELYNLNEDPSELNNMIEKNQRQGDQMIEAYQKWSSSVGVK